MRIFKYPIGEGIQSIRMPKHSKILTVQAQGEKAQLWALCEPSNPLVERSIVCIPTGGSFVGYIGIYIATVQLSCGAYVLHVFDFGEKPD